jgi:DMSO reductase anchor subunit
MANATMATRMEMIPARRQTLWGWPAVINFALGGLGAGWYLVAALAAGFAPSPGVTAATWAAPVLVLAGFAAVAGEAGRPLRGPRVLRRLGSSWMSRELLVGLAFVLLAAADLLFPLRRQRALASVAAVLLVLAQGFILRGARGITAWDVPVLPLLFLLSAFLSGAGAYLLAEVLAGRPPASPVVGAVLVLVVAAFAAWGRYLAWRPDETYRRAVAPLRDGRSLLAIDGAGHALPLLLGVSALGVPALAAPLLAVAGALLVAGQIYAKARLVLVAGQLRPITLAIARPGRRPS